MPEGSAGRRCRAARTAAALSGLLAGASALLWLVGFPKFLAVALVLLWGLYLSLDRLLGRLASWAIGRTPKAFIWTIECVCIRPSFSWRPHAWSEIIVINWTWHNPPGFSGDATDESLYILQIDRLTLRLELASIYRALRKHEAVQVDMLLLEGVRLKTQRNEEAALNLWEALDLPDSDVNITSIVQHARRHGGMQFDMNKGRRGAVPSASVKPLPPVSTEATRKAAKYTRPEWLRRRSQHDALRTEMLQKKPSGGCLPYCCSPCSPSSSSSAPPPVRRYFEYPIGDPRRRPRWGVPMRFDIRQMSVVHVELWIFDLLTMDHRWRLLSPGDTKMAVSSLFISRECLEAGDERRGGGGPLGDTIHGVYLGELIWVLIGQLLPKVLEHSPSNFIKTATFVAGFAIRDSAVTACARVLDFILDAKQLLCSRIPGNQMPSTPAEQAGCCHIHVHLIRGRGIAHEGQRVNVHARLELRDPTCKGKPVDTQFSTLRIWTKTPWWDQHFCLGPASSVNSVLRIVLFCRKTRAVRDVYGNTGEHGKIGEVVISLQSLLVRDKVIDDQMVGWFLLEEMPTERNASGFRGRLKLGLKLTGRHHLRELAVP